MWKHHSFTSVHLAVLISFVTAISAAPAPLITPAPVLAARAPDQYYTPSSLVLPTLSLNLPTLSSLLLDLPTPTCTRTIQPDKNGYLPPGTCDALYNYYPSFNAAVLMAVIFGIISVVHVAQAAISKTPFCWVVIMGALWEFGGYISRAAGAKAQQNSGLATVGQLLILLGPLWVNAFGYMVLARMIWYYIPERSLMHIKPGLLAIVFVVLDFGSFVIQLVGGGMAGPGQSQDAIMRGIHLYMGGIGLQEAFIVIFLGSAIKFHLEMLKVERTGALVGTPKEKWRWMLYALYVSLVFITMRIIFRLVEFSAGDSVEKNPLPYHEIYVYVFDALPMTLAILVWNVAHPGRFLTGPDAGMPSGQLRKFICCCCPGRERNARSDGKKIRDSDEEYVHLSDRYNSPLTERVNSSSPDGHRPSKGAPRYVRGQVRCPRTLMIVPDKLAKAEAY